HVIAPLPAASSGILAPPQLLRMRGGADHIKKAVAIYIEQQIAKIFGRVSAVPNAAEWMFAPDRTFVPIRAGHDVEMTVTIDVADGASFIGSRIDHVPLKQDLVWPLVRPRNGGETHRNHDDSHSPSTGRTTITVNVSGRILRCGRLEGSAGGTISKSEV